MPYIKEEEREWIRPSIQMLGGEITTSGMLNYVITTLLLEYMKRDNKTRSYALINEVIGVLECAKLEMYRKVASPYEDEKCQKNGEVYE